jgi:hypothetical protein
VFVVVKWHAWPAKPAKLRAPKLVAEGFEQKETKGTKALYGFLSWHGTRDLSVGSYLCFLRYLLLKAFDGF